MTQLQLQPPTPFDFRTPDDWPRWKRRFDHFRVASGLATTAAPQQVSTLLYCIGEEAEAVLASTGLTEEERKDYDAVLGKFDKYFKVRWNIIFERAHFNRCTQLEGKTAEKYITELYTLADTCEYGDIRDEMIRDRLVVGIRDATLSQQLQLDAELTLEKANNKGKQWASNRDCRRREQRGSRTPPVTAKINAHEQKTGPWPPKRKCLHSLWKKSTPPRAMSS